jgi:hypothetical protein
MTGKLTYDRGIEVAPEILKDARAVYGCVLEHLIRRVNAAKAETEPFGHVYFTDILPTKIYHEMLSSFPPLSAYDKSAERYSRGELGGYVRTQYALTSAGVNPLPARSQILWRGIAAALTAPELKRAVFAKLAPDLVYRYHIPEEQAPELAGYSRPTLYRETEGFEIPPHPDTRKKVVTLHLYLPADESQLDLGTGLYRRRLVALPVGNWRHRFEKVKQFEFRPNSGYAFVVNNTLFKRSWHGRERLLEGSGVRNTLLNTFYEVRRNEFTGYLPEAESQD